MRVEKKVAVDGPMANEGEHGSFPFSPGQVSPADPLGFGQRWKVASKRKVVPWLLRGEQQHIRGSGDIGFLARSQVERHRTTERISQGVDFRRASAAGAPDGLALLPPFPPAAERCALIEVGSSTSFTGSLLWPASAAKIACQRSRLDQRLKRL